MGEYGKVAIRGFNDKCKLPMPTYTLPTFNLSVNIWRFASITPPVITAPPDVVTVGNLNPGKRVYGQVAEGFPMYLLLPKLTDVRWSGQGGNQDWIEVPAGSGRWYETIFVDDVGKGFPNEHRLAIIIQVDATWPLPMP